MESLHHMQNIATQWEDLDTLTDGSALLVSSIGARGPGVCMRFPRVASEPRGLLGCSQVHPPLGGSGGAVIHRFTKPYTIQSKGLVDGSRGSPNAENKQVTFSAASGVREYDLGVGADSERSAAQVGDDDIDNNLDRDIATCSSNNLSNINDTQIQIGNNVPQAE